jgi:hypothetical protein
VRSFQISAVSIKGDPRGQPHDAGDHRRQCDPVQRDALYKIMTGAETEEMATGLVGIYSAMAPNKLEPLFLPIAIDVDVDRRRGRLHVPGILDITAEPIRIL